ncbi:unnamed protein product [Orchesella dallaii]|uniref:Lipase domain-containing protein n=1 Tax=Orchesella dallaii TaxID=48710 RepID=A0ABP1PZ86_9HEXA
MSHISSSLLLLFPLLLLLSILQISIQSPHCYTSKVHKNSNRTLCEKDYFIFPNIWEEASQHEIGDEEKDDNDVTLCCPIDQKTRVDDKTFWWPDENQRGLTRAILNCHPSTIPGMETIRFLYYTNNNLNPDDYKEIFIGNKKSLRKTKFVKGAPLKIIFHGFMSNSFIGPASVLRAAYSKLPYPINIIAVQWEALANLVTASDSICYNIASQSTKLVGKRTSELIEFLVAEKTTELQQIHLLGHSLGAHCAGFAGKFLKIGKVQRITGFDPARPNFELVPHFDRIHHTDAHFVDIIHTATKDWKLLGIVSLGLFPFPVGLRDSVGHADFYPNHGSHQPGCKLATPTIPVLCSHARSYAYYAESIAYFDGSREFTARECLNFNEVESGNCTGDYIVPMGEYTPTNNDTRKLYFLSTNKHSPFVVDELDYIPIKTST